MSEFDKYRRRGDYHWKEYARDSIYKKYVDGLRGWVDTTGRVLDVGAGDGLIASVLGMEGVELDDTAVRLAKAHGVAVRKGDATALPYDDASFDAVFMGDVIEHLPDPAPALREARRVLRHEGRFYVTTPPRQTPLRPYHYREYLPPELQQEVEHYGFVLIEPMHTAHERIHGAFRAV